MTFTGPSGTYTVRGLVVEGEGVRVTALTERGAVALAKVLADVYRLKAPDGHGAKA